MFNWYRNWKKRIYKEIKLEIDEEQASLPSLHRAVSEEAEKYRDSRDPWVTIIGDTISDDGIQIALDWNDAFITYLKAEGITGSDETQIVQKWLAMIAKQTADKLETAYTDTDGNVSDYQ